MLSPQKNERIKKDSRTCPQKTAWSNSRCEYQNPPPKNEIFAAKKKNNHYRYPLFSFEHIVLLSSMQSHVSDWTQFLWFHWPSPLQRPEGLLPPWVSNLSRQTTLQSMRATTFNHACISEKDIDTWPVTELHMNLAIRFKNNLIFSEIRN